jgi:hypothetical protein
MMIHAAFRTVLLALFFFFLSGSASAATIGKPTNFLGMVGYWTFDGSDVTDKIYDRSGSDNHGYVFNAATSSAKVPGKVGQAMVTDGVDDRLSLGDVSGIEEVTSASWSFWIKPESLIGTTRPFITKYNDNGTEVSWRIMTGEPFCGGSDDVMFMTSSSAEVCTTGNFLATSTWTHVVIAYDGTQSTNATKIKIYIDGEEKSVSTGGTIVTSLAATNSNVTVGSYSNGAAAFTNIAIDEFRIYNRTLTANEARALYKSGGGKFGASVKPQGALTDGLIAHWTMDGKDMTPNIRDVSTGGNHGNLSGQTSTTTAIGKLGQALSFDGVDDCATTAFTPSTAIGTGAFTVSYWVYPLVTPSGTVYHFGSYNGSSGLHFGSNSSRQLVSRILTASVVTSTGITFTTGTWNHIIVSADGSTYDIYKDGVAAVTDQSYTAVSNNRPIYLGCRNSSGTADSYSNAVIDDVRIYNRAISATEATRLFAVGAGNKSGVTPTGAKGPFSSGLVGHWTFDGPNMLTNVQDVTGNGHNGVLAGFTSTTTGIGKVGQALLFDGDDDRIGFGDTGVGESTNVFTVSLWIKPSSADSAVGVPLVTKTRSLSGFAGWALYRQTNEKYEFRVSDGTNSATAVTDATFADTNWHHVVGVADGSALQIYVDGVVADATPPSFAFSIGSLDRPLCAGASIGNETVICTDVGGSFGGLMDDLRIYHRALSAAEISQLYNLGR